MQKIRNKEGIPAGQKLLTLPANGLSMVIQESILHLALRLRKVMGKAIMVEVESLDHRQQEDKDGG